MNEYIIDRAHYLKPLEDLRGKHIIKVITGLRRSGKSILLQSFAKKLLASGVADNYLQIYNFEEPYLTQKTWQELYAEISEKLLIDGLNYVFLDEVQNISEFEKLVDGLFIKENVDLYITGSNARLLSSELATLLSGRHVEISILPFSFNEFLQLYPDKNDLQNRFKDFLFYGGLPQAADFLHSAPDQVERYLQGVYKTILTKDILTRKNIKNEAMFDRVMRFAMDNISNLFSPANVANVLSRENKTIDNETVSNYLSALTESFVLYKAKRFDIRGKELLKTQEKYYSVDTGLRRVLLSRYPESDLGRLLENVVYLELLRRGNRVFVGKIDNLEIDFVAQKTTGELAYYQIAWSANDHVTFEREIAPLKKIKDNYPKYLLTTDFIESDNDGIKRQSVIEWLTTGGF